MIVLSGVPLTQEEQTILDLAAVRALEEAANFWRDEMCDGTSYEEHALRIGRTAYKIGLGLIEARRELQENVAD